MNEDQPVREALNRIACENVSDNIDLTPRTLMQINQLSTTKSPRMRIKWAILATFLVLVGFTSIAAYAYYRNMVDPGLQSVENAGLITNLELTGQPSKINTNAATPSPDGRLAVAPSGVSARVDWAFADESRIAMQFTVFGLSLSDGVDPADLICKPYIRSSEGIAIGRESGKSQVLVLDDQPAKPVVLTYIYHQPINTQKFDHLNLNIDLTIGPCNSKSNFQEDNSSRKVTPYPFIGNYHFEFSVPVYKGIALIPNQIVNLNGVNMRLEALNLNPSYSEATLCFQPPVIRDMPDRSQWIIDAVLAIGSNNQAGAATYSDILDESSQNETCVELGFETAYQELPAPIQLTVNRIALTPFMDQITEELAEQSHQKLITKGIEVEFINDARGYHWQVIDKPAGMDDAAVYQAVVDSLAYTIDGPWIFIVEVNP